MLLTLDLTLNEPQTSLLLTYGLRYSSTGKKEEIRVGAIDDLGAGRWEHKTRRSTLARFLLSREVTLFLGGSEA